MATPIPQSPPAAKKATPAHSPPNGSPSASPLISSPPAPTVEDVREDHDAEAAVHVVVLAAAPAPAGQATHPATLPKNPGGSTQAAAETLLSQSPPSPSPLPPPPPLPLPLPLPAGAGAGANNNNNVPSEEQSGPLVAELPSTETHPTSLQPFSLPLPPSPPLPSLSSPLSSSSSPLSSPSPSPPPSPSPTISAPRPPSGPFIRPYDSSIDFYDCLEICHLTAPPFLQPLASTSYASLISSIWCKPYLLFTPHTCFILDDGSGSHSPALLTPKSHPTHPSYPLGKAVGYIIGPPSTNSFVKVYKDDYLPLLDAHFPSPHPQDLLTLLATHDCTWLLDVMFDPDRKSMPQELLAEFGAHFYVHILPPWRRQGFARGLLQTWEKTVMGIRNSGGGSKSPVKGAHVAVGTSNEAALMWCRSNGFEERGEDGLRVEESAQCGNEAKKGDDGECNSRGLEKQERRQGQDSKWMVKKLMMG